MLNSKQQEAVLQVDWPVLILAWAGSWKTSTLTARVKYMIQEKGINPDEILCVTFTNKAWKEMKERISSSLNLPVPRSFFVWKNFPYIWTFHSIWMFFLKSFPEKIWLKKDFIIYDESDKLSVIKNILKEMWLDEKIYPARTISFHISNAKNSLITPISYKENFRQHELQLVVWDVYEKYENRMKANFAIDFDDILTKTLELLRNKDVLDYYQNKFKYFMVDEYQDTNKPQYEIVKLLASRLRNLCVVWDDWQSIYSWRWANMQNILDFNKDYKDAKVIKLEQNYRSTWNIINLANSVIKNNSTAIDKTLFTDKDLWEKIQLFTAVDDRKEAEEIANNIKEKWDYKDCLVLYRTNSQSRVIEETFMRKWIPYKVVWGQKFYDRKEIKDILAYLRFVLNEDDSVSLRRIINTPSRKIWDKTVEKIGEYANSFNASFKAIMSHIDEVDWLWPQAKIAVKNFMDIIWRLEILSDELDVAWLIEKVVDFTDYKWYLTASYWKDESDSKIWNIDELINVASEYWEIKWREWLRLFLEEVALISDLDGVEEENDYVCLMTIHTSKWLEYKNVYIAGFEQGLFPHARSLWNPLELEEERRLLYVAITRAKEFCMISRAKQRLSFWNYTSNPPSVFLKELEWPYTSELESDSSFSWFTSSFSFWNIDDNSSSKASYSAFNEVKNREKNNAWDFSVWQKVEHPKFGLWMIESLKWEIADIRFSKVWNKKMNVVIAPIKII